MLDVLLPLVLLLPAVLLALPVVADLGAAARALRRTKAPRHDSSSGSETPPPRLLYLVPAHDEEGLIGRCVESLHAQDYPADRREVVVVADHCGDATATAARRAGARVLERGEPHGASDTGRLESRLAKGKHHAIGWALERIALDRFAAVVLVDADTVVDPDFSLRLATWAPLENRLVQARVAGSNEDENWLTRMSAVLTRCRWDLALALKERGGLNCPLTGDGTLLGTAILGTHPWRIETVTEGWELYTRFTLEGLESHYEPEARLYAQETRSLEQSRSQRERWTAGRLTVLRRYLPAILSRRGVPLLQRIDLLAELSSTGPVFRSTLGIAGAIAAASVGSLPGLLVAALFAGPVLLLSGYTAVSLARDPHPLRAFTAFLRLPWYAGWRAWVGVVAFVRLGTDRWVRTERHDEERIAGAASGTELAGPER